MLVDMSLILTSPLNMAWQDQDFQKQNKQTKENTKKLNIFQSKTTKIQALSNLASIISSIQ